MSGHDHVAVDKFTFVLTPNGEPYCMVKVRAGAKETERIVPPAGEDYAFDIDVWSHSIDVCVSPTGRSVQVWVDGKKVSL